MFCELRFKSNFEVTQLTCMQKWIVYLGVFVVTFIVGIVSALRKHLRQNKMNDYEKDLRANGKRFIVQLGDCEVKTNSYYENVDKVGSLPSRVEMLDALYDDSRLTQSVKKSLSVLIYRKTDPSGKIFEFRSKVIELSREDVYRFIEQKKEGTLYVDERNWNRYYFDIGL